jgi:hypothetical protein
MCILISSILPKAPLVEGNRLVDYPHQAMLFGKKPGERFAPYFRDVKELRLTADEPSASSG